MWRAGESDAGPDRAGAATRGRGHRDYRQNRRERSTGRRTGPPALPDLCLRTTATIPPALLYAVSGIDSCVAKCISAAYIDCALYNGKLMTSSGN